MNKPRIFVFLDDVRLNREINYSLQLSGELKGYSEHGTHTS